MRAAGELHLEPCLRGVIHSDGLAGVGKRQHSLHAATRGVRVLGFARGLLARRSQGTLRVALRILLNPRALEIIIYCCVAICICRCKTLCQEKYQCYSSQGSWVDPRKISARRVRTLKLPLEIVQFLELESCSCDGTCKSAATREASGAESRVAARL